MSTQRRIFNYDDMIETKLISSLADKKNLYSNSISACGCLIYKNTGAGKQLLLISYEDPKWNKLDDFGGRIDESDSSIFDAIARETSEETNGVLSHDFIKEKLDGNNKSFYNNYSKYYVVAIEVDRNFCLNTNIFGDFEDADKIKRTVGWHNFKNVKEDLALRLKNNNDLMKFLEE